MTKTAVTGEEAVQSEARWSAPVLFSFAVIYLVWGSTFFAIRVAVAEFPPLYAAGLRFTVAGLLVYAWARWRNGTGASTLEWRNSALVAIFMFLIDYGLLFWAETGISSGIASVLVGAIPIWTVLAEVLSSTSARPSAIKLSAMLLGLAGVAIVSLTPGSLHGGVGKALAVVASGVSWSIGSVLAKRLVLPRSKPMGASLQMLTGGLSLLLVSVVTREMPPVPHPSAQAWGALVYLILAGSVLAFTCYVYLLAHLPASSVASYAYVNPVVALCLGAWLGHERITTGTVVGAVLVILSVLLILRGTGKRAA